MNPCGGCAYVLPHLFRLLYAAVADPGKWRLSENRKMKRSAILLLGILFSIAAMAQKPSDSLTMELKKHFNSSDLPGFSVAIVSGNGVLYENSFGFANRESKSDFKTTTIQKLGSVSKTVVGLALVKAIEDGKLTMDTKINDILPFHVINPFYKDSPLLIRHLANHTSTILDTKHYGKTYVLDESFIAGEEIHQDFLGFLRSHNTMELKDFLFNVLNKNGDWYQKKNFLKAEPGSTKAYSNLNAALTAYIIEMATEMPFEEYTETRIFEPLGMESTSWQIEKGELNLLATLYFPKGKEVPRYRLITYPDGGLFSNTVDLSNYLQEMILAYSGRSTYLPSEFARLMFPGDDDINRAFWGMGEKSRNIGHGGSDPGVQTDLQFNADMKIGRIILTNVNAEDNEMLWNQYRGIHDILARYENKLIDQPIKH